MKAIKKIFAFLCIFTAAAITLTGCTKAPPPLTSVQKLETLMKEEFSGYFTNDLIDISFQQELIDYYPNLTVYEKFLKQSLIGYARHKDFLRTGNAKKHMTQKDAKALQSGCNTISSTLQNFLTLKQSLENAAKGIFDAESTINLRDYDLLVNYCTSLTEAGINISKAAVQTFSRFLGTAHIPTEETNEILNGVFENIALENFVFLQELSLKLFVKELGLQPFLVYESNKETADWQKISFVTDDSLFNLGDKLNSIASSKFNPETSEDRMEIAEKYILSADVYKAFAQKHKNMLAAVKDIAKYGIKTVTVKKNSIDVNVLKKGNTEITDLADCGITIFAKYQFTSQVLSCDARNLISTLDIFLNNFTL